jgi:hypothetical protein
VRVVPRSVDGGSTGPSQNETVYHLPGVYAKLTALEKVVDGRQDPRCCVDDAVDNLERQFWPVERSRLLPQLEAGEAVLINRTHAVIVGGWPEPSMSGSTGRAEVEGIGFFDGLRLSVRDIPLSVTGWVVRADDTITASYAEPPGPQRFWELDGVEVTGAGQPMAQYLAAVAQGRAGGRNGRVIC